jgi:hypothetical protein
MRDINNLTMSNMDRAWAVDNSLAHKPQSTQEVTQRVIHILDAKCEKADLQADVSTNCTHLSLQDQNKLLELLIEFEELFDGTLGDWKTEPISFELKEGAKQYHGRPYPVPNHARKLLSENRIDCVSWGC